MLARTFAALVAACLISTSASALGSVTAHVDVSRQTMDVYLDGAHAYSWPVSTARSGKWTPRGRWTAKWLSKNHRSSRYDGAPMPYAIFYSGNFAIHGTNQTSRLGRPASAGCVRLHPQNAAHLFGLAQQVGLKRFKVVVVD